MAFIRRRLSGKQDGSYSYQILESYREGGKIKQRNLYNIGPSPHRQGRSRSAASGAGRCQRVVGSALG